MIRKTLKKRKRKTKRKRKHAILLFPSLDFISLLQLLAQVSIGSKPFTEVYHPDAESPGGANLRNRPERVIYHAFLTTADRITSRVFFAARLFVRFGFPEPRLQVGALSNYPVHLRGRDYRLARSIHPRG